MPGRVEFSLGSFLKPRSPRVTRQGGGRLVPECPRGTQHSYDPILRLTELSSLERGDSLVNHARAFDRC
jgi:hypothetical protein